MQVEWLGGSNVKLGIAVRQEVLVYDLSAASDMPLVAVKLPQTDARMASFTVLQDLSLPLSPEVRYYATVLVMAGRMGLMYFEITRVIACARLVLQLMVPMESGLPCQDLSIATRAAVMALIMQRSTLLAAQTSPF